VTRCLWTAAAKGPIVHSQDDIWLCRATVEWYWQGKTEELGGKPVPVPLCPPQNPHGLNRARTRVSAVRGQRLAAWSMLRQRYCLGIRLEDSDKRQEHLGMENQLTYRYILCRWLWGWEVDATGSGSWTTTNFDNNSG
jgi:hypothetical protein